MNSGPFGGCLQLQDYRHYCVLQMVHGLIPKSSESFSSQLWGNSCTCRYDTLIGQKTRVWGWRVPTQLVAHMVARLLDYVTSFSPIAVAYTWFSVTLLRHWVCSGHCVSDFHITFTKVCFKPLWFVISRLISLHHTATPSHWFLMLRKWHTLQLSSVWFPYHVHGNEARQACDSLHPFSESCD